MALSPLPEMVSSVAKSEESELRRPHGISPPVPLPVVLSSRQRALLEGLINFGPKDGPRQLGIIYQGVLTRLADTSAPDCAAHAAHGARELMEKLAWYVNNETAEEARGRLGDRADAIEEAYEAAVKELPPERARWEEAQLTHEVVRLIDAVEHMAAWRQEHTLSPGTYAIVMVDFCLGGIPERLRANKRKEWAKLRDFFADVAHHRSHEGRAATPADVAERFAELEAFLYARWAPETVRDFAEIDALIKPREGS
jgi:hypothetical protein